MDITYLMISKEVLSFDERWSASSLYHGHEAEKVVFLEWQSSPTIIEYFVLSLALLV